MKCGNCTANLSKNLRMMLVLAADLAPTTNIVLSTLLLEFSCTTPREEHCYVTPLRVCIYSYASLQQPYH